MCQEGFYKRGEFLEILLGGLVRLNVRVITPPGRGAGWVGGWAGCAAALALPRRRRLSVVVVALIARHNTTAEPPVVTEG